MSATSGVPDQGQGLDRRTFIVASAAGLALATLPLASRAHASEPARPDGTVLGPGADLGAAWRVETISGVEAGAIRVIAAHADGRRAVVGICRREPGSNALARTATSDLFLMNDGRDGRRLTADDEVRMVERLARHLDAEARDLADAAQLLGRRERLSRFDPIDHLDYYNRQ